MITKIIFGKENLDDVSFPVDENIKDNFEIAWDIWENFEKNQKSLLSKLFGDLESKIKKELLTDDDRFIVSHRDWGSLYISRPEWIEKKGDRGIYAIAVEKWDRDNFTIGIVRNRVFKTSKENELMRILQSLNYKNTQRFIGYIPLDSYFYFNNKEFFLDKFLADYDNLLGKIFTYLEKIYEDLTEKQDLLNLFEESVKERKEQLMR